MREVRKSWSRVGQRWLLETQRPGHDVGIVNTLPWHRSALLPDVRSHRRLLGISHTHSECPRLVRPRRYGVRAVRDRVAKRLWFALSQFHQNAAIHQFLKV